MFKHVNEDHQKMYDILKESDLKWIAVWPPHISGIRIYYQKWARFHDKTKEIKFRKKPEFGFHQRVVYCNGASLIQIRSLTSLPSNMAQILHGPSASTTLALSWSIACRTRSTISKYAASPTKPAGSWRNYAQPFMEYSFDSMYGWMGEIWAIHTTAKILSLCILFLLEIIALQPYHYSTPLII